MKKTSGSPHFEPQPFQGPGPSRAPCSVTPRFAKTNLNDGGPPMQNLPSGKATWLWKIAISSGFTCSKKKNIYIYIFNSYLGLQKGYVHILYMNIIYIYICICLVFSAGYHTSPSKVETTFLLVITMEDYDNYDWLFRPHESKSLLTYINPMNSAAKSRLFHLHPS